MKHLSALGLQGSFAAALASASWDRDLVSRIGSSPPRDFVFGWSRDVAHADFHSTWLRWALLSAFDISPYIYSASNGPVYTNALVACLKYTETWLATATPAERRSIAIEMAQTLCCWAKSLRNRQRTALDVSSRRQALAEAGPSPRCWVCGHKFSDQALSVFRGITTPQPHPLTRYVDYITGRGIKPRDFAIEVDHVTPINHGGGHQDNLRLACGYCNRVKSDHIGLYDVHDKLTAVDHPKLGRISRPQPLWVVRHLALRPSCESTPQCGASTSNEEMRVALHQQDGAPCPPNLITTCPEHDPMKHTRFVPRRRLGSAVDGSSSKR